MSLHSNAENFQISHALTALPVNNNDPLWVRGSTLVSGNGNSSAEQTLRESDFGRLLNRRIQTQEDSVLLTQDLSADYLLGEQWSTPSNFQPGSIEQDWRDSVSTDAINTGFLGGESSDFLLVGGVTTDSFLHFEHADPIQEVVFVDAGVERSQLDLSAVHPNAEIIFLSAQQDGIQQITDVLATKSNLAAIHIISHGREGSVSLGSGELSLDSVDRYQDQLRQWQSALSEEADLLLYGCNVAGNSKGDALIQKLGELTGADIAASDDLTGEASEGGDWILEAQVGEIETQTLNIAYEGVLFDQYTVDELYTAWQEDRLPVLDNVELSLDSFSNLQGQLQVDTNNGTELRLSGTGLSAFVGQGMSTVAAEDDSGLRFTDVEATVTFLNDGDVSYDFSGTVSVMGIQLLSLEAETVSASKGSNGLTQVSLSNAKLAAADIAQFEAQIIQYNPETHQFSGDGINVFLGHGAATADEADNAGLAIVDAAVDLHLSGADYSYRIYGESVAVQGIEGLVVAANRVEATGDATQATVNLSDALIEADGGGRFEGQQLTFKTQKTGNELDVSIAGEDISAFVGQGHATATIEDDLGLSITNADLDLTFDAAQSYSYSFNADAVALRGQQDLSLTGSNIAATGDRDRTTLDLGNFALNIGTTVNLSGSALRFSTADDKLEFGATGVGAFLGSGFGTADALGVELSAASLGLALYGQAGDEPNYALKASGSAALLGVPDVTLSGALDLEVNATGAAVAETIALQNGETIDLNLDDSGVELPRIAGMAELAIAGFVGLTGEFAIEQRIVAGENQQQNQLLIGARDVNAFVGSNQGTSDAVGIGLSNGQLGLYIEQTGAEAAKYALKASGEAGIEGVAGLTASGGLDLSLNRMGDAVNQEIQTPDGAIALNFSQEEADLEQITGQLDLGVDGFAELSGEFGIEQKADALHIGGRDASAFVGANGKGLQVSDTDLGLILYTDSASAGYAVQGKGNAELVGIDDVTLTGEVELAVNRSGKAVNEAIALLGDDITVQFADGTALTQVSGSAALDVAGFVSLNGELYLDKQTSTVGDETTTDLLLGITDANALVGSGSGSSNAVGVELTDSNLGLVLSQTENAATGETRQGYALKGSGSAGLLGVDGLGLSGALNLELNRMGEAVNEAIAIPNGSVTVNFDSGDEVTNLSGSADLNFGGVVQASGDLGLQKTVSTDGSKTDTKLLIGLDNARTFVGAEGGTDAAAGIELSEGQLGLAIYSQLDSVAGTQTSTYAVTASGAAELQGVDELSLDGTLAVRINETGEAVNETVQIGTDESLQIIFDETQGNQMRVEGTVTGNAADALAFGGEFSMEWFTEQTPGALNQASNPDVDDLGLTQYQTQINESLYQSLRQQLTEEKERLEADNSNVKSISATVDGWAFNEDFVDLERDWLTLQAPHGWLNGQKVVYAIEAGAIAIGGLVDGQEYEIQVINDQRIQLVDGTTGQVIDLTSDGQGIQRLREVEAFDATNEIRVDIEQDLIFFIPNLHEAKHNTEIARSII